MQVIHSTKYFVAVWGEKPHKKIVYSVGCDKYSEGKLILEHCRQTYPTNHVGLFEQVWDRVRTKAKCLLEFKPDGHYSRDRLKAEIEANGDKFIYGTLQLPAFMHRRGKGKSDPLYHGRKPRNKKKGDGQADYSDLKKSVSTFDK